MPHLLDVSKTGEGDELEEARRNLIRALSIHSSASPRSSLKKENDSDSGVNASSLTDGERRFLESILNVSSQAEAGTERATSPSSSSSGTTTSSSATRLIRKASERLSNAELFLLEKNNNDVAGASQSQNGPKQIPTAMATAIPSDIPRESKFQDHLFRVHERNPGMKPSVFIRKMSSLQPQTPPSNSALAEKKFSVMKASNQSQGFEVFEENGKVDSPSTGEPSTKNDQHVQFQGSESLDVAGRTNNTPTNNGATGTSPQWDLSSEPASNTNKQPVDAGDILHDEYFWNHGYPGEEASPAFRILGTSADDVSAHPHVLSPPLMESLMNFMPEMLSTWNFWLKHSLVRDGPGLFGMLRNIRASERTILALETADGHVFGSYTSAPWRPHWGYYGGVHDGEAFVWRMRRSRLTPCRTIVEQAMMESELEVYPCTGDNTSVQLCRRDKIGVGGGEISDLVGVKDEKDVRGEANYDDEQFHGFAISLTADLMSGTSSSSETFGSPCLTNPKARGDEFELTNLEVWAMTPHDTVPEAERDELTKLFFGDEEEKNDGNLNFFRILMGA